MDDSTQKFYDRLSSDYHLIYQDWDSSILRQSKILHELFNSLKITPSAPMLDCTCGIGTQTIGLKLLGYNIQGCDISEKSISRAKIESKKKQLKIEFKTADIKNLSTAFSANFNTIISFDNSIPHLLTYSDLLAAFQNIYSTLDHNGYFIGSIRDYDSILKEKPTVTPRSIFQNDEIKVITYQEWDWEEEGSIYNMNHYILIYKNDDLQTITGTARYRAYRRKEINELLLKAGFDAVEWKMPKASNYYQPIFIGYRK